MEPVSRFRKRINCAKLGYMILKDRFEQRTIGSTFGSFRSLTPLDTPSGSQWTESELETELLDQIRFTHVIHDILTQPIIHYTKDGSQRIYTPDMIVQMREAIFDGPECYLIEVKREDDLKRNRDKYKEKFQIGRIAARRIRAEFRIFTEKEIRTPNLENARRFQPLKEPYLSDDERTLILRIFGGDLETPSDKIKFVEALERIKAEGISEPDARYVLERAIAQRCAICDFNNLVDNDSILIGEYDGWLHVECEPIVKMLREPDLT